MKLRWLAVLLSLLGITRAADAGTQKPSQEEMQKLKEQLSGLAVQIAKEGFNIDLDYSVESVKHVEYILGEAHKEYKKTGNADGLNGIALEFAAYLIKVIEKNYEAGVWERDHAQIGPNTYPFHWRGADIFPYGWCAKRIFDGDGDNVWTKFQTLVVKAEPKK